LMRLLPMARMVLSVLATALVHTIDAAGSRRLGHEAIRYNKRGPDSCLTSPHEGWIDAKTCFNCEGTVESERHENGQDYLPEFGETYAWYYDENGEIWGEYLEDAASVFPCTRATDAGSSGDPHARLPHGGTADYRGNHNETVCFVSAKDVALNVKTVNSTFKLGLTTVAGTFISEAHLAMLTHAKSYASAGAAVVSRWFNVSFWAEHLNQDGWAWNIVTGSCSKAGNPPVPFTLGYHAEKRCDDLMVTTDFSSATVETKEFRFVLRGQPVYNRIDGPRHRIDVEVTQKVADREFAVPPHGLIGQAYDGDGKPRAGRLDVYPPRDVNGTFTTTAMAEGAIDGVAADYVVASPFETRFKYSAFAYPMAPAAVAAVEAKRDAMAAADGQLRAAGAVERD